jgi:prephenate dehydratase
MFTPQIIAYLGPAGTFTEMAVRQMPNVENATLMPVASVVEALDAVLSGAAARAVVPIENSIEGGVSATLDALATTPGVQIFGEYLVPVSFNLLVFPGKKLADIRVVLTHPVAYAQCRSWLANNLSDHSHIPASSTASAARALKDGSNNADAAIAPAIAAEIYGLETLASDIGDNKNAQTRFIEIGKSAKPNPKTGSDKTSVIVELPDDRPGGLLGLLEQFAARGVNLSRIESRPVGDHFGRYRFNLDAQGHIEDEAIAEALMGLHRFSPKVIYLGSYKKADQTASVHLGNNADNDYTSAQDWLNSLKG